MKRIIAIFVLMIMLSFNVYADEINTAVLCYHSVSDNPLEFSEYCISNSEFEDDVKYFADNGYTFLKPCEMWYAEPSAKNIVLTADDGYENFYTFVFPALKKYNAKAAVYVIGSRINKKGYLKDWQIKEMDESGLVEIGNHTTIIHKRPKNVLESYFQNEVLTNEYIEDIKDCSGRIYNILGHGTESFAYPYGSFTNRVERIIRTNLGYTTTFTTEYGMVENQSDILSPMKRIYRVHGDNPWDIEQTIESLKQ